MSVLVYMTESEKKDLWDQTSGQTPRPTVYGQLQLSCIKACELASMSSLIGSVFPAVPRREHKGKVLPPVLILGADVTTGEPS